jgi:hypothetical protein
VAANLRIDQDLTRECYASALELALSKADLPAEWTEKTEPISNASSKSFSRTLCRHDHEIPPHSELPPPDRTVQRHALGLHLKRADVTQSSCILNRPKFREQVTKLKRITIGIRFLR